MNQAGRNAIRPVLLLALVVVPACNRADATTDIRQAICPPPDLFEHAVCLCGDFDNVGTLDVMPGPAGVGSVGVNGSTSLVADATIAGSWITGGRFDAVGAVIGDSLVAYGDASWVGDVAVGGDVMVGGDLSAVGAVDIGGTLGVAGTEDITGDATIASRGAFTAPAGAPCGCDPSTFFDVRAAVDAAAIAAGGSTSWSTVGTSDVHLATGSYYVTSADVVGESTIHVDGAVSVFVDGDLASVGELGQGDAANPDAFRLYVGGDDTSTIAAVGDQAWFGSIYAPRATLAYVGDTRIVGSVFAHELDGVGTLTIEYGHGLDQPTSCEQPPTPEVVQ